MLKKYTPPFSVELIEQLEGWVSQQQQTRGINLEVPMNLSSVLEKDSYPESIYLMYEEENLVAAAVVVDILQTRDFEIGLAARDKKMVHLLVKEIDQDLQKLVPNSVTVVIDDQAILEKKALEDHGATIQMCEAQLTLTQINTIISKHELELLEYQSARHQDYRNVLMESFGDDVEEAEAIIELSLTQASRTLYGILVKDEIVGTINLIRSEQAFITAFAIHPKHQKKGFGRAALYQAVDRLLKEGYQSVSLDVEVENTHALKLYEAIGFRIQYMFQFYQL
jgi:ribosomal protein S18 acetylase RimI-like enzyme